jgi:proteasome lid subunit RPN8/RPN11
MESLSIAQDLIQEMVDHVQQSLPEEACGLLAGQAGQVKKVIPITNQAHSPVRFFMEPVELCQALTWIDEAAYALIGIYHSHPNGPSEPSQTDIKQFLYPGTATVILSFSSEGWNVYAFNITPDGYDTIKLEPNRNDEA